MPACVSWGRRWRRCAITAAAVGGLGTLFAATQPTGRGAPPPINASVSQAAPVVPITNGHARNFDTPTERFTQSLAISARRQMLAADFAD